VCARLGLHTRLPSTDCPASTLEQARRRGDGDR
jgi:hypothetical protein